MPFGLQVHMAAAHGPDSAKHQLNSAQRGNETSSMGGQHQNAKRKQGRPFGKKSRNFPRRPSNSMQGGTESGRRMAGGGGPRRRP